MTGGDDQSLRVTVLGWDASSAELTERAACHLPNAHWSAVKAVSIMPGSDGQWVVFSAGSDSRLRVWELSISPPLLVERAAALVGVGLPTALAVAARGAGSCAASWDVAVAGQGLQGMRWTACSGNALIDK